MNANERMSFEKEFNKMIDDWISQHGFACKNCKNRTDKRKDGCRLNVYCIVKDKHGMLGFEPETKQD